jgi:hypothetical protein
VNTPFVAKRLVEVLLVVEAFVAAKLLVAVALVKVRLPSVVRPVTLSVEENDPVVPTSAP